MLVLQRFQYALRLTAKREVMLRRWAGCRRFVFNEALALTCMLYLYTHTLGSACPSTPRAAYRQPGLLSQSYFVASVGGAPLSAIKQYVEQPARSL
jgi:hypothetical protein